jgi:hypothetical protein
MSSALASRLNAMHARLRGLQTSSQGSPMFVWRKTATSPGVSVPCTGNTYARTTVLDEGGFQVEADAKLYVLKTHFLTADSTLVTIDSQLMTMDNDTPRPVTGRTVVYSGRVMRIALVADPLPFDPEANWVLVLQDPSK